MWRKTTSFFCCAVYKNQVAMSEPLSKNAQQIYEQMKSTEGSVENACSNAPTDEMKTKCKACMEEDDQELCVAKLIDEFEST